MDTHPPSQASETVPKFGLFEVSFAHTGDCDNPYTGVTAAAQLTQPDGKTRRRIPLFWDGGRAWKLRFSPDRVGPWEWAVQSSDAGLHGQVGRFDAVDSENSGGIRPMEDRPYHFRRQNGEPFWFMGDTGWALYTDNEGKKHDRAAGEAYIDPPPSPSLKLNQSILI